MESSVGSAIEKIKRDQEAKQAQLKAKRELEASKASAERSLREIYSQIKKFEPERMELIKRTDELRGQVTIQKIRRDALSAQLNASNQELVELKAKAEYAISEVHDLRSNYCKTVQEISDNCDVWALLSKPTSEPLPRAIKKVQETGNEQTLANEVRLRNAVERREKAIAERDRLKSEPDVGDEFVRKFIQSNGSRRFFSSKIEPIENEPIKFSTSLAATKTIRPVLKKVRIDMPWYQPYSVVGSVAVFLIYFCVIREENDVDQEFTKTLYQRIKGLEKEQLLQSYKFNKEHGKSVAEIEARLKEIEEQEAKQELEA